MPLTEMLAEALGEGYTVERELGGGGMSRVFVAHDRRLDRRVVVKLLRQELAASVSVDRFRREILLSAGLQHPNIVPVLGAGEVDGHPYLVMPYVAGESLRAKIAEGPMRVPDVVRILRDVARALAYAHERGVVHRDIKPDNILLSSGAAVVADFGVAKALQSALRTSSGPQPRTITAVGTALGTPDYMAPEQIAADPAMDHRADLYAFGAMAYEMLAGVTPFHSRTPQALFAAHLSETPRPLGACRSGVPAALCALVERCLAKDPADRPQNAAEILDALDDPAVISGAFATPGDSAENQAVRRSRRVRLSIAAAALAAVGLGVAGVMAARRPGSVAAAPAARTLSTVAVLPLVYLGADSSSYLAESFTSELTSALGRVRELRVASRSAATALQQRLSRGERIDGSVGMFLEGVVEREGNRVRVDARLVDARDGFMLWAESYEGSAGELFRMRSEMGAAVADAVRSRAAPADSSAATAARSADPPPAGSVP
jgi:eukaryotic-like serine/threonine-protein kinase